MDDNSNTHNRVGREQISVNIVMQGANPCPITKQNQALALGWALLCYIKELTIWQTNIIAAMQEICRGIIGTTGISRRGSLRGQLSCL